MRWRLLLEEYDYTVEYKTGKRNVNADVLSRNPVVMTVMIVSKENSKRNALMPNWLTPRYSTYLREVKSVCDLAWYVSNVEIYV
jgi:hypothetical protein